MNSWIHENLVSIVTFVAPITLAYFFWPCRTVPRPYHRTGGMVWSICSKLRWVNFFVPSTRPGSKSSSHIVPTENTVTPPQHIDALIPEASFISKALLIPKASVTAGVFYKAPKLRPAQVYALVAIVFIIFGAILWVFVAWTGRPVVDELEQFIQSDKDKILDSIERAQEEKAQEKKAQEKRAEERRLREKRAQERRAREKKAQEKRAQEEKAAKVKSNIIYHIEQVRNSAIKLKKGCDTLSERHKQIGTKFDELSSFIKSNLERQGASQFREQREPQLTKASLLEHKSIPAPSATKNTQSRIPIRNSDFPNPMVAPTSYRKVRGSFQFNG
ncbi:hypothetical protein BJX76DRAFT_359866 [Aspergillus varians]